MEGIGKAVKNTINGEVSLPAEIIWFLSLAAIAFSEAVFFPVPPDVILIPIVLSSPDIWFYAAVVATLFSAIGAMVGHEIGKRGKQLFSADIRKAEEMYEKYGDFAIILSAITPIPYKIFTIASGVLGYDRRKLFVISLISRGIRFVSVAWITKEYGKTTVDQIISNMDIFMVLIGIGVVVIYYLIKRTRGLERKADNG